MTRKIIQNEVECAKCGDRIYSAHRHDFRYCKCGAIAVDGGMEYLRRVGDIHGAIDRSMSMEKEDLQAVIDSVQRMKDLRKNNLGITLAVIRELRDRGYLNMEKFQ